MRRIWQPMHNIHAPRLTVPLDTLTVTYGRTSSVQPISNAYKNWIATLSSETCMTIATAKLPGLIITSVISPHATLTAIAFWYLIIMIHCQFCRMYILLYSCLSLIASAWPTFWMHCNKRMVMTSALKMAFSLCLMPPTISKWRSSSAVSHSHLMCEGRSLISLTMYSRASFLFGLPFLFHFADLAPPPLSSALPLFSFWSAFR